MRFDDSTYAATVVTAALLGACMSYLLTLFMLRYSLSARLIDHPNERSSHSIPTPRGGGVAIVVSFLVLAYGIAWIGLAPPRLLTAMLVSGGLVAVVGFLDDTHPLPVRWRFLAHTTAAVWSLWIMHGIPPVPIFGISVNLGWFGLALAAVYLVWMINLFNFMDGIDGIASVEAITSALGGALVWWLAGSGSGWILALVFASCVGGFLLWNFPPAKIFMGDAGSGFLGLMVALLSLWCGQSAPHLFWAWFILIGCFMVDGTTTLVRRVRRGDKFNEAHRSHAYQYAARQFGAHRPVTLAVAAINLLWLLPIAVAVALGWLDGVLGVVISYAPLLWLAFHFKAGDRAAQELI